MDIVFEVDQLRARAHRIEQLLDCVLVAARRRSELLRLIAALVQTLEQRRGVRALLARHYSLLARKVAERSAETGEHYITRNRAEYRDMLRARGRRRRGARRHHLLKFGVAGARPDGVLGRLLGRRQLRARASC